MSVIAVALIELKDVACYYCETKYMANKWFFKQPYLQVPLSIRCTELRNP